MRLRPLGLGPALACICALSFVLALALVPVAASAAPPGTSQAAPPAPVDADTIIEGSLARPVTVRVRYRAPVSGPVVRAFEQPATPYAAGHRGVDLAVPLGAPVRAAGSGTVAFAGVVAGHEWVSIDHPDGIRTSYGSLADVGVQTGAHVDAGAVLGRAAGSPHVGGPRALEGGKPTQGAAAGATGGGRALRASVALHWGARRGSTYVDPMLLLAPWQPTLIGPGGWRTGDVAERPGYADWDGRRAWYEPLVPGSPVAEGPGWDTPPNPNRVVGVAGLNSHSGSPPLDLTHLGYAPEAITSLSYADADADADAASTSGANARERDTGAPPPPRYTAEDTWDGVVAAAEQLEDQLRAEWRHAPGQAVDLVGHSLGGVVIAYYLLFLHDPADPGLPPVDHVVTIASPLQGADLADVAVAGRDDPVGRHLLHEAHERFGLPPPTSATLDDLAVGSPLLRALAARWEAADRDPTRSPLAVGTEVLTLGAQADLVVPEHRSDLPGAPHAVLPGSHDRVRRTEASRVVLRAFLAGEPLPAVSGGLGHAASYGTSGITQVVGRTVLGGWR